MEVYHIVATTEENGIGFNNAIPWAIPEDMAHFRKITTECAEGKINVLIMGRKTWDSIPNHVKPFWNRISIVLSSVSNEDPKKGYIACNSLQDIFKTLPMIYNKDKVFIIGGSNLYKYFLRMPIKNIVYMTKVSRIDGEEIECDTFFPDIEKFDYKVTDTSELQTSGDYIYQFMTLTNF